MGLPGRSSILPLLRKPSTKRSPAGVPRYCFTSLSIERNLPRMSRQLSGMLSVFPLRLPRRAPGDAGGGDAVAFAGAERRELFAQEPGLVEQPLLASAYPAGIGNVPLLGVGDHVVVFVILGDGGSHDDGVGFEVLFRSVLLRGDGRRPDALIGGKTRRSRR